MQSFVLLNKAAGEPTTGATSGEPIGVHGRGVLLLSYTKGTETSLRIAFFVVGEDGTAHALYQTDGTTIYAPFGTLIASLSTPRAVPVLLGSFEGFPNCLIYPRATIVGSPDGTSAYRLELQIQ